MHPKDEDVANFTDSYFVRTKGIVEKFGDCTVTYAVFLRRPCVCAPKLAVDWIKSIAKARGVDFKIEVNFNEGDWVGAGEPLMYLTGSFRHLADLETLYLQKLGACCVGAYNAYTMCIDLPHVAFMAMDARHCAGTEMAEMMAYAASVGSRAARQNSGALGFVGCATNATAHFFGRDKGLGTMPHALIGYAGSTLKAAQMFHETYPDQDLTVLVDYFGQEVTDALDVCRHFPDMAARGRVGIRLDTHGGRFLEGLDPQSSYAVLERHEPKSIRGYRTETELRYLVGTGVSAAAIWHMREQLDKNGFTKVKIIASSGFGPAKCKVMAYSRAPIDVVGTGSYLPEVWGETYATSDIIAYDGVARVKVGREFLIKKREGQP